jgi:hypothetical protein
VKAIERGIDPFPDFFPAYKIERRALKLSAIFGRFIQNRVERDDLDGLSIPRLLLRMNRLIRKDRGCHRQH